MERFLGQFNPTPANVTDLATVDYAMYITLNRLNMKAPGILLVAEFDADGHWGMMATKDIQPSEPEDLKGCEFSKCYTLTEEQFNNIKSAISKDINEN